ncbi:MAG: hypothetical protein AAF547_07280 [Actinomycetota bacterium]
MTRWFEPLAMFRLLLRIWSTRRMTIQRDQADPQSATVFDHGRTPADEDYWFDYVADLGDAFDPTMCVAWHLGRRGLARSDIDPRLRIDPEFGTPNIFPGLPEAEVPEVLPRGRLLLMGGDQVYPSGSDARYRNQVTGPYDLAWERDPATDTDDGRPDLLAIPANHDWYGGLGPFVRTFCGRRVVGGRQTAQSCSWWSARLAHGWWVWGIDTALDGEINDAQYQYFRLAKEQMPDDARLIVCIPVPAWRLRERYIDRLDHLARFLLSLGVEPEIYLSGDYHIAALHRRERPDGVPEWHLTTGGGGAFQHPVHNLDRQIPNGRDGLPDPKVADPAPFRLIATWPSNAESREGTGGWWHLLFDRAGPTLLATLVALQLPLLWLSGADHRRAADVARSVRQTLVDQLWPVGALTAAALLAIATFVLAQAASVAPRAKTWARRVGFGHGIVQAATYVGGGVVGNLMVRRVAGVDGSTAATWLTLTAVAAAVGVASIVVVGTYLRVANRQFRMHDNESYSSRHSGDNRHFARLRITPDGTLSCYLIAFRHTGRDWAKAIRRGEALPPDGTSRPELIDVRFRTAPNERPVEDLVDERFREVSERLNGSGERPNGAGERRARERARG